MPIAFGTVAAVYPHGDNAKEFEVLVRLGMSELEALRSATTVAAAVLDHEDAGADRARVPGRRRRAPRKPLDDITVTERPVFVMKDGRVFRHDAAGIPEEHASGR